MNLCGINISCHHYNDLFLHENYPSIIVTVNAEAIVRAQHNVRLKNIINNNVSTIDGQIPLWLYKLKYRNTNVEKISGSDLIYSIPSDAEKNNLRVFLLGGQVDSNRGAVEKLKERFPHLLIEGFSPIFSPYPFPVEINLQIEEKLRNFKPDILFVGFGMGKQEYWEEDHYQLLKDLGTKLIIGCGGSFEFASGKIKRAPLIIQKIGLEGIWRLLKEFKWFRVKRLLISAKIFYYYIVK